MQDNESDRLDWGICGIVCTFCPFFTKTHLLEDAINVVLSQSNISPKGREILNKLKEIKCEGCPKSIFSKSCEVRKCALARGLDSCLKCEEFPYLSLH